MSRSIDVSIQHNEEKRTDHFNQSTIFRLFNLDLPRVIWSENKSTNIKQNMANTDIT